MEKLEEMLKNTIHENQRNLGYYETLYKADTKPATYDFLGYWKDNYEYCKIIDDFLSNKMPLMCGLDINTKDYSEGVKDAIVLRDNLIEQLKDVYPPYYWSNIDKDTEIKEVYIHKLHVAGLYSNLIGLAKEKTMSSKFKNEQCKVVYLLPLIYVWEDKFHYAIDDLNSFNKYLESADEITDKDIASINTIDHEKVMFEETKAEAKKYFNTIGKKLCDVYFYSPQQYVIDNH